jgi:hypothetical protein
MRISLISAGTTAAEVAHFLASGQTKPPNAYRVLNTDGSIPDDGMLHWTYRIADLHKSAGRGRRRVRCRRTRLRKISG